MKTNITELVFILDRSGSMAGLEGDTIGGFNSLLNKQKKESGEAFVTTVLFDSEFEILHDRLNVKELSAITEDEYYVRGTTALLDAIGKTITKTSNEQKLINEKLRADKVLIVIVTDGMENSSREYGYKLVNSMINRQKEEKNWEFIFLGANIDAIKTAEKFGINEERAANFHSDSKGTKLNYETIGDAISNYRCNSEIKKNWKEKIDRDFSKRQK